MSKKRNESLGACKSCSTSLGKQTPLSSPLPDFTYMWCSTTSNPLSIALRKADCIPSATATIFSFRMKKYDLEFAKSLPVLFSQVREDPQLDLKVINSIARNGLNVLMIGSGGCKLAGLAYHSPEKIESIDVIDPSHAQIELCKLKLFLSKNLHRK